MANYTGKPVTIRGITCPSAKVASEALCVVIPTIYTARSNGTLDKLGSRPLRRIRRADLEPLWSRLDIPTEVIATHLGVSRSGLSAKAHSLGLPSRERNRLKKCDDVLLAEMWTTGVSLEEIRQHFGYAQHQNVTNRVRQLGLATRERKAGNGGFAGWPPTISLHEFFEHKLAEAIRKNDAGLKREPASANYRRTVLDQIRKFTATGSVRPSEAA